MSNDVTEQQLVEAIRQIPANRFPQVLEYLSGLQAPESASAIHSGTDLAGSPLIGVWADRTDVEDSLSFARRLRAECERRTEAADAP